MTRLAIFLFASILLLAGAAVQADSNKQNNNNGQSQSSQQNAKPQKNNKDNSDNQNQHSGKKQPDYKADYDEDYSDIHRVFEQNKGKSKGYQSLPPGISKNLQRGKPLPPGIAKKFNSDIERQLPYYPGHEWRQVGTDAVLIDATTSVVQEVMRGVLE